MIFCEANSIYSQNSLNSLIFLCYYKSFILEHESSYILPSITPESPLPPRESLSNLNWTQRPCEGGRIKRERKDFDQKPEMEWPLTHSLFALFRIEQGKDQISANSKVFNVLVRSNSFYRDMALFIGNKTGVQCRSHHQKYESKYKYPHKIIKF